MLHHEWKAARGPCRPAPASWLVSDAEDAGFEPARGCPQHAFQVCGTSFMYVRVRFGTPLPARRGPPRIRPDDGERDQD